MLFCEFIKVTQTKHIVHQMWSQRTPAVSPSSGRFPDDTATDWSLEIDQCYNWCHHFKTHHSRTKKPCQSLNANHNIDLAMHQSPKPPRPISRPSCALYSSPPSPLANLCAQLDRSVCISNTTTNPRRQHRALPEHDRKILNRMAAKRRDAANRQASAAVAHHFCATERSARETLRRQHAVQTRDFVGASQASDMAAVAQRREARMAEESAWRVDLRMQQLVKGRRSVQRAESMRSARRTAIAQRAALERQRSSRAEERRDDAELGEAVQVQRCWTRLASRLDRADRLRRQLSEDYRQRLMADNETQMAVHAAKLVAAKEEERQQADELRQHIWLEDQRCEEVARQKRAAVEEGREQARWTAELREELRRTMGADGAGMY